MLPNPKGLFFDLLLTKYSPPRWNFRWCCKRLKEEPFKRLALELSKKTPVLNLVGNRREEARWRDWYIKKGGDRLVYASPLLDLKAEDVWKLLEQLSARVPELGFVYRELKQIYGEAKRSGCWFCPLIVEDRLLKERPQLLKLKYQVLVAWCSGRREEIVKLSKEYPHLISVTIKEEEVKNEYYPCGRKCLKCQVPRVVAHLAKSLQEHPQS
jgi:3'-phosphoadenosine 5'-phosphosulfate sulfotransferase (PAPS reductase)/FAD synthetase